MGQEAKEKGRRLNRMIVAIDGPAGVGKSTVAKLLAARLGYLYLDTGALYRAVAWNVLHHGVDPEESQAVESLLPAMSVQMEFKNGSNSGRVGRCFGRFRDSRGAGLVAPGTAANWEHRCDSC